MALQEESEAVLSREYHKIEVLIGTLLRVCVIATVVVVLAGAFLYLPSAYTSVPSYRKFLGEPQAFRNVWGILGLAFKGDGRAIIETGMLLLILTPILRVAVSVVAFLYEKDYLYVVLTLIVFGVLIFSLSGGA